MRASRPPQMQERRSTIAIVDESGVLKGLLRMDGAPLLSVQVAQDKAYTAAAFGIPTDAWYDFIKDDAPLAVGAPTGIERLVSCLAAGTRFKWMVK